MASLVVNVFAHVRASKRQVQQRHVRADIPTIRSPGAVGFAILNDIMFARKRFTKLDSAKARDMDYCQTARLMSASIVLYQPQPRVRSLKSETRQYDAVPTSSPAQGVIA